MTETDKILNACKFLEDSQGYIDINQAAQFSGVPSIIVANVLKQNNYKELNIKGQYKTKEKDNEN